MRFKTNSFVYIKPEIAVKAGLVPGVPYQLASEVGTISKDGMALETIWVKDEDALLQLRAEHAVPVELVAEPEITTPRRRPQDREETLYRLRRDMNLHFGGYPYIGSLERAQARSQAARLLAEERGGPVMVAAQQPTDEQPSTPKPSLHSLLVMREKGLPVSFASMQEAMEQEGGVQRSLTLTNERLIVIDTSGHHPADAQWLIRMIKAESSSRLTYEFAATAEDLKVALVRAKRQFTRGVVHVHFDDRSALATRGFLREAMFFSDMYAFCSEDWAEVVKYRSGLPFLLERELGL